MLPLRRHASLRTRLATRSVQTPPSCPFSASTHRCLRQRRRLPSTRRAAANASSDGNGAQRLTPTPTPVTRPGRLNHDNHHDDAPPPTSPPPPPDTSVSGPYKQVLLSSRSIVHRWGNPPASASASASAAASTKSHLTTRTTPQQARQLSAADRFFSSHGHSFLYSAELPRHHPPNTHVPEMVILGASNVGKSTFLNALVGSSSAARVSQKPGRTTLMNAFGVGPPPKPMMRHSTLPRGAAPPSPPPPPPPRHSLVLVDTPGYGYRSQASWGDAVVEYLRSRTMLRGAVVLLSSDKRLLREDTWLLRTLAEANTRTLVVLTKADKGWAGWADRCVALADAVQAELAALHHELGARWRDSDGPAAHIYITSAGIDTPGKLRNGAGMGGVRAAILEMAGFALLHDAVTKKPDTVTYSGPIVSFDDIPWST
ncbi:hypothetical protein E4U41_006506 [Claviceps citrina]|nr:hypothetical protein E4U41_006506 [Claviceps citrina]